MRNQYVFRGWRMKPFFSPDKVKNVKQLLDAYAALTDLSISNEHVRSFLNQFPEDLPLDKCFLGTSNKKLADQYGMQRFQMSSRPALVLAAAPGGFYCAIEDFQQSETNIALMVLSRYPRLCGHLICSSLGYASPVLAAKIVWEAHLRQENWCEWIYSCYNRNPLPAVQDAVRSRHNHRGYMAEYQRAKALVKGVIVNNGEPAMMLASWF